MKTKFLGMLISMLLAGLSFAQGQNAVIKMGIDRGGLVIGGDYIIEDSETEAVLAYASLHSKSDSDGARV